MYIHTHIHIFVYTYTYTTLCVLPGSLNEMWYMFLPWEPDDASGGYTRQKFIEVFNTVDSHPLADGAPGTVVWDLAGDPGGTAAYILRKYPHLVGSHYCASLRADTSQPTVYSSAVAAVLRSTHTLEISVADFMQHVLKSTVTSTWCCALRWAWCFHVAFCRLRRKARWTSALVYIEWLLYCLYFCNNVQ